MTRRTSTAPARAAYSGASKMTAGCCGTLDEQPNEVTDRRGSRDARNRPSDGVGGVRLGGGGAASFRASLPRHVRHVPFQARRNREQLSPNYRCERHARPDKRYERGTMMMKKFITIAVAALAAASFSAIAAAQTGSSSSGMSAAEHQQMMSGNSTPDQQRTTSDADMHRRMMAMMDRCEKMMAQKDKSASLSRQASPKKTSAEGKWAWRPNPRQAPGPRAPLLAPIRVWVPAEKSSNQ